jgi:hypothetical protein
MLTVGIAAMVLPIISKWCLLIPDIFSIPIYETISYKLCRQCDRARHEGKGYQHSGQQKGTKYHPY